MSAFASGFHVLDYVIFGIILGVSLTIGLYHAFTGGKQRTTKEYFHGGGDLKTLPVALSILVSFVSAILVLGTPAEMYTRGTQLTVRVVGYCIAVTLSSLLFVPLFYKLKVTSSFEYLEMRFHSKGVKLFGTFSMISGSIFYMGLVMYSPSTALEAVTGFPVWASIVVCGVVATVYTTLGGMRAVVWTDVFQAAVMILGMLLIVVQGTMKVGGLSKVFQLSNEGRRLTFFNFDPDPTQRLSFWSLVIGGTFSAITIFGIGQTSVQRYCSLPTLKQAKRSVYLNIPGLIIVNVLASLTGLVVYAYYADQGCDPLEKGYISNSNQLVPYFVMDVLRYPGVAGIFLAVLFSGALSSLSSALNSLSAVTWQDILKYFFRDASELKKSVITKILVIFYGGVSMMVAAGAEHIKGHVLQASLSFTGATSGPTLGLFLLGAFFSSSNATGAIIGCAISTAFSLWLAIGTFITKPYSHTTLPTSTENCLGNNSSDWILNQTTIREAVSSIGQYMNHTMDVSTTAVSMAMSNDNSHQLVGLQKLYGISFLWYSVIGAVITVTVGLLASWVARRISGHEEREVNPDLIVPLVDNLCCCFKSCHFPCWRPSKSTQLEKDATEIEKISVNRLPNNIDLTRDSDREEPSDLDTEIHVPDSESTLIMNGHPRDLNGNPEAAL